MTKNQLANEKSPYLQQHVENPVDWYPWGKEAFDLAKKENKPIFLSIGYSTCHWCHVMAHESFEDSEVASLMNNAFVNIKVDREERPDIDGVYMEVAQMITGRGGWPLTIIMTPDKKPFYAATYIPKESRYNLIGMKELVPRIEEIWKTDQANVDDVISRIEEALSQSSSIRKKDNLTLEEVNLAYSQLEQRFDDEKGGFGSAPKFPSPHNLMLILRYWKRTGDEHALYMVEKTLQEIRKGGLFDHIGYGFHRYSTDADWLVPHFEKMLYDQAGLMMAYTEAYQITKKQEYASVVREIFEYVTRDLISTEGAFLSAEDADSEGEEGKFYTWSQEEIEKVLGGKEAALFLKAYNIHKEGNFEGEATRKKAGLNIPHLTQSIETIAVSMKIKPEVVRNTFEKAREKLFSQRDKRVRPSRDDKILTDWNGFMVAALARAGTILEDQRFIDASERALSFILDALFDDKRNLFHRYKDGEAAIPGFLDDYAYLIWALLESYEATFKPEYLKLAKDLTSDLIGRFWDSESGGFYFTDSNSEELLFRKKDAYDGAIPSGNSVVALNLIRLARFLGDSQLEEKAAETIRAFSDIVQRVPSGFSMMLNAVEFALGESYEVVIVGDPAKSDTQEMLKAIRSHFIPNRVILLKGTENQSDEVSRLSPFTKFHDSLNGRATAHVCIDYNCKLPTTEINQLLGLLGIEAI
jgi:uncharacterized protein YyaL (SSP411 family)